MNRYDDAPPVIAIILGGGMGSRFGGTVPKQLAPLAGGTVISHTAEMFERSLEVDHLVVVTNPGWQREIEKEVRLVTHRLEPEFVSGGGSRNESLRNALAAIDNKEARLLIHDAVRPLVTLELIREVVEALVNARCVLPIIRSSDLLVATSGDGAPPVFLDREEVFRGQSPQGFFASDLRIALDAEHDTKTLSLPTIYEAVQTILPDRTIEFISGAEENLKITLPVDHMVAQHLIAQRDAVR